jgi:hypothetical protein
MDIKPEVPLIENPEGLVEPATGVAAKVKVDPASGSFAGTK